MCGEENPNEAIGQLGTLYCAILDNVATRLDAIGDAVASLEADPHHQDSWKSFEFAYLQVRKCVEYLALAILAVHRENEYECLDLENAYKADIIFRDLIKVNPHGFPTAFQMEQNQEAALANHVEMVPTLSKRRLKRIYDDCAVHLHSGTLAGIINQEIPPCDLGRVASWKNELESLLRQHSVMLPHAGLVMLVWLRDQETGRARAVFGQADGPLVVEGDPTVYNDNPQ